jgi:hypothetical protein
MKYRVVEKGNPGNPAAPQKKYANVHFLETFALLLMACPSFAQQKATIYSINNHAQTDRLREIRSMPFRVSEFAPDERIFHFKGIQEAAFHVRTKLLSGLTEQLDYEVVNMANKQD